MPLDVLGCTRATLMRSTSVLPFPIGMGNLLNTHRDGDRLLQLLIFNEEFLVSASHQLVLITSLTFVMGLLGGVFVFTFFCFLFCNLMQLHLSLHFLSSKFNLFIFFFNQPINGFDSCGFVRLKKLLPDGLCRRHF